MKYRKYLICAVLLLTMFVTGVSAAAGDVEGYIYSTDILACVNGREAPSYNIGGRTVVVLEELDSNGYGISCNYDDQTRTLTANGLWYYDDANPTEPKVERGRPGRVVGKVYRTDIKVYFNGMQVKGYNLGGRTAVCLEDLGALDGTSPNEEYGYSKYLCSCRWNGETRTISLNTVGTVQLSKVGLPCIDYVCRDNVMEAVFDPINSGYYYGGSLSLEEHSEEFASRPYVLRPLYLETKFGREQVGLCFVDDRELTIPVLDSLDPVRELVLPLVEHDTPCEQALKRFDDGVMYRTLDQRETKDHIFLVVQLLQEEGYDDARYIAVNKEGGYFCLANTTTRYTSRELEVVGDNTVRVRVYPFAGPHGATHMSMELEMGIYEELGI